MEDYRQIEARGREVCDKFKTASYEEIARFGSKHKGRNIVTPNNIRYLRLAKGKYIVEVAWGRGIRDETMYGVSVLDVLVFPYERRTDLSEACFSASELEEKLTALDTGVSNE